MKIEVEALSPVEKKVTVEVDPERVAEELDRAYTSLGRRVKLRGFRAGKVPRKVLERNFKDEVERDVVEKLVGASFSDAVREHALEAVAPPRVDVAEQGLQQAQPFRFTARVEVKPKLEPKDYQQLEVTRRPVEVTDAMVAEELGKLQESLAQLVPVEGRAEAQAGDYGTVDFEGTIGGQPFDGNRAEGVTARVDPGEFLDGFLPQLAGKKLGETLELDQSFPEDYRVPQLRGKTAHFVVTLKGLKVRQLPALDDELAKDAGVEGAGTLEALRARLREDLEKREKRRSEAELRDALVKAALAKNDFEVPPALVERAIDAMIQGAADRFARQGLDFQQMGLDLPRIRADLREQALLQVKGALLLEAIADREKIEVTDDDVQAEIARTATELNLPLARVQQELRGGEGRRALQSRVREDKALAFLTSSANFK